MRRAATRIKPRDAIEAVLFGVLAALLAATLILSLAPPFERDTLVYHLAVPKLYLKEHGIVYVPGNIYSNFPFFTEMFYVAALALGDERIAALFHFAFFILTIIVTAQLCKRLAGRRAIIFALLLMATAPVAVQTASTAYVEMSLAFYTALSLLALFGFSETGRSRWFLAMGIFAGFSVSIKYTALLYLPLFPALVVINAARTRKPGLSRTSGGVWLFLAAALVFGAPFYIKNFVYTGNPLYPFFYSIFGGIGWDSERAALFGQFMKSYGLGRSAIDYLLLPFNIFFRATFDPIGEPRAVGFDGQIGPGFALSVPLAILLAAKKPLPPTIKVLGIFAAVYFAAWAFTTQQIRFLIPVLPAFAALAAHFFKGAGDRSKKAAGAVASLVLFGAAINFVPISRHYLVVKPYRPVFGFEKKDAFLGRMLPQSYESMRWANSNLPSDSKILLVWMRNYGYYLDRAYYTDAVYEAYTIEKVLAASSSADEAAKRLKAMGFTHLMINQRFFLKPNDYSSEAEIARYKEMGSRFGRWREEALEVLFQREDVVIYAIR